MERVLVFHGLTETDGESKVFGVVRVTSNKILQGIKSDAKKGVGFDEIMFKYHLKQLQGEDVEVSGQ